MKLITVSDANMLIVNSDKDLEKQLIVWKKELIMTPPGMVNGKFSYGGGKTNRVKLDLFSVDSEASPRIITTFSGFLDKVTSYLKGRNSKFHLCDNRKIFNINTEAYDNIKKYTRPQQFDIIKKFVDINKSGCISLPTRYGKTRIIAALTELYKGYRIVLTVPGVDLIRQLVSDINELIKDREISIIMGNKKPIMSNDITVCSIDSLDKLNEDLVDIIICDEVHASVTDGRVPHITTMRNAKKIGVGATLKGRFDNMDILIEGVFGPTLVEKTFREAVDEGSICDIRVYMIRTKLDSGSFNTRNQAYKKCMYENIKFHNLINEITNNIIPDNWQTLLYISTSKQAESMLGGINNSDVAMAKLFKNDKHRIRVFEDIKLGKLNRVLCSKIYGQGTTFPDLRCIVNCEGGGGSISSVQKPGRLAQIREGKKRGYVFDFLFYSEEGNIDKNKSMLLVDSINRMKTYKEKGYDIVIIDENEINKIQLI